MRYRLVVLSHGDCAPLEATLRSFAERVSPRPESCFLVYDGPELYGDRTPHPRLGLVGAEHPWAIVTTGEQRGFCPATRLAWRIAASDSGVGEPHEHVFYLEHDFVFERDVDLRELARVIDLQRDVCQMQLMRDAVSDEERAAGGLFELRRDAYDPRVLWELTTDGPVEVGRWLYHRAYLTTNPCLMRRDFMADHPWPDYPDQCEGRFGLDLVREGLSFGVWGDGSPWARHAGVRDGAGFGY